MNKNWIVGRPVNEGRRWSQGKLPNCPLLKMSELYWTRPSDISTWLGTSLLLWKWSRSIHTLISLHIIPVSYFGCVHASQRRELHIHSPLPDVQSPEIYRSIEPFRRYIRTSRPVYIVHSSGCWFATFPSQPSRSFYQSAWILCCSIKMWDSGLGLARTKQPV